MSKYIFTLAILFGFQITLAQTILIDSIYGVVKSDSDLVYGTAVDYKGCIDSLKLDIYKPIGRTNASPLMVLVHGGSFVAGSKNDPTIVAWANYFAAKGYVVAAVNYRLGVHVRGYVPAPINDVNYQCLYAETNEMERAAYRGMQDVRGAIRYLWNRSSQDSTLIYATSVLGESAGGFIANMVGFMDVASEKPVAAGALADAPTPANNLNCPYNICAGPSLARPDLGPIEGTLNLSAPQGTVNAAISMYGGMFSNLYTASSTFAGSYAYHQTCDAVVPSDSGKIYRNIDNCLYYCTGWTPMQMSTSPIVYGAEKMSDFSTTGPLGLDFKLRLIQNGAPPSAWPNCNTCVVAVINPAQYGYCHATLNQRAEADSIAIWLYPRVVSTDVPVELNWTLHPNPASEVMEVHVGGIVAGQVELEVVNMLGQVQRNVVQMNAPGRYQVDVRKLSPGIYFAKLRADGKTATQKFVVAR